MRSQRFVRSCTTVRLPKNLHSAYRATSHADIPSPRLESISLGAEGQGNVGDGSGDLFRLLDLRGLATCIDDLIQ
jgi:hypothetical protein